MPIDFTAGQYVDDVLSGRVVACAQVIAACRRHEADMQQGQARGLRYDEGAAKTAVGFFSLLRHWKGEWANQPITLQPWQQFVVASLFGWKREDGTRRFRTGYLEVARKNGKTTIAAGIGLYMLVADGEQGGEVYTAATKLDQARIAFHDARTFAERSPALKRELGVLTRNIHHLATSSKMEALSSDHHTMDGLNVHCAICDELHAWETGELANILETGMGSRRQPLMLFITTAGMEGNSYCLEVRDYAEKVLNRVVEDDSFFGIIYTLDSEDQEQDPDKPAWWTNESAWVKSNPNLGISKTVEQMREKAKRASEIASNWTPFVVKELNVWTQSARKWLNLDHWRECGKQWYLDEDALAGRICYSGLDLGSTTDLCALTHVFPLDDGIYAVLCRFFMPADNMAERVHKDKVPLDVWVRDGWVSATPGNVADYDFILNQLKQDIQAFRIRELAFDRWGSQKIVNDLLDIGFTTDEDEARMGRPLLVQFGQGYASMSAPSKELEKLVLGHKLWHGNNPVLTWMASNVVIRSDGAENIKPDKDKSTERIDGIVALIMGLARAMSVGAPPVSVYATRGLLSL